MDLVGLAAILAVPVSAVTVGIAIARERSQIRLLERVVSLRQKVNRGSTTDFTLLWLEQGVAEDLLRSRSVGPVRVLGLIGLSVSVIGIIAVLALGLVVASSGYRTVPAGMIAAIVGTSLLAAAGASVSATSLVLTARYSRAFSRDWATAKKRLNEMRGRDQDGEASSAAAGGRTPPATESEADAG